MHQKDYGTWHVIVIRYGVDDGNYNDNDNDEEY